MSSAATVYDAVLLVSFGGPEGPDDVAGFLRRVTAGRSIPEERLAEVGEHYLAFGGVSPINEQCRRIRAALEGELARRGRALGVYWGNRNWHPLLADTVRQMADDGVRRALAVVTSAYSSYSGCRQYLDDIAAARAALGEQAPQIDKVRAYFDHPGFVEPWADAVADARSTLAASSPALVFTAHSIPVAMAEACDYETQLRETARLIAERSSSVQDASQESRGASAPSDSSASAASWSLAWQSRSGPPQVPWLEPDINDELGRLAAAGTPAAVIAPIGFVSDHIEVLWDLDNEARQTAESLGIETARAVAPGTAPDPRFVAMLADLIDERLDPAKPRAALGALGVRPDRCPADCCPQA